MTTEPADYASELRRTGRGMELATADANDGYPDAPEWLERLCDGTPEGEVDHEPYGPDRHQCGCGSYFRRCGCPIGEEHDHVDDEGITR